MSTRVDATPSLFRRGAVVAALLAAVWLLAGCSSGASDSSFAGVEEAYEQGEEADGAMADAADSAEPAADDRALIVTGAMYMTVEDPIGAADRAADIVARAGGRVDARSETAPSTYDGGSARLTLRIPASTLDATVDELRALGTVDEFSTDSADVTVEVRDLDAQISTLRASTARIESLLADAEDIKDIITLEDELDGRQARLESLEARQRGLDDQVSMSTIELSLTTEPVVIVDDAPRSFWGGLESGWDGLVAFVSGALVVAGVLLPWVIALALLATVALAAVRVVRSRRTRAAAASSDAPESPAPARGAPGQDG
ncbi:DUF4349 domain-containing protein [Demequina sp. SYSU T00192]|uniref:DUF4349 domain-containing protein n=1 Tax=Demequina litoralis TaxID=3051660 RepID=A0ABT8G7Q5_9MICO|nr:DUF4349 domain-containing protein [Demequina sp. SYSU T00192]MDN4475186.1 DUF4349 domain-containing protein [Demequina sp. SYSU T00192]